MGNKKQPLQLPDWFIESSFSTEIINRIAKLNLQLKLEYTNNVSISILQIGDSIELYVKGIAGVYNKPKIHKFLIKDRAEFRLILSVIEATVMYWK